VSLLTACQVNITKRRLGPKSAGNEEPDDVPPPVTRWRHTDDGGEIQMVLWPALTLLGFLVLTALVIAMGTQSTARYEREQNAERTPTTRHPATEPVGAVAA
jgi:hypothetical protein